MTVMIGVDPHEQVPHRGGDRRAVRRGSSAAIEVRASQAQVAELLAWAARFGATEQRWSSIGGPRKGDSRRP